MAVLDEITAERERLTERLARLNADRQKLADQIAELDAAERVLSRFGSSAMATAEPGRRGRRARSAEATDTGNLGATRRRQPRRGSGRSRSRPEVPLSDASLRAIEALGNEATAEQIREHLGREFGLVVRGNHLGRALHSHRRAGRLDERGGRWSTAQMAPAETGSET